MKVQLYSAPPGGRHTSSLPELSESRDELQPGLTKHPLHLAPRPTYAHGEADEVLIADTRAGLTPAQMVELKLQSMLKGDPLPISYFETRLMNRGNRHE